MEALAFYEQQYHAPPPSSTGYPPSYQPPVANPQAAWLGLG